MNPSTRTGNPPQICSDCGARYWSWGAHAERCVGSRQPVEEVAQAIASHNAYRDSDAVRVARAYLTLRETT